MKRGSHFTTVVDQRISKKRESRDCKFAEQQTVKWLKFAWYESSKAYGQEEETLKC